MSIITLAGGRERREQVTRYSGPREAEAGVKQVSEEPGMTQRLGARRVVAAGAARRQEGRQVLGRVGARFEGRVAAHVVAVCRYFLVHHLMTKYLRLIRCVQVIKSDDIQNIKKVK